jgi:hypothetical protein
MNLQENIDRIKEVMGLDELNIKKKRALGRGQEKITYRSTINPNMVFKIGSYGDLMSDKEKSEEHPNIYAKIFEVRKYNGDDWYSGVAIMEKVDTKKFLSKLHKLESTLESLNIDKYFIWGVRGLSINNQDFKDKFEETYKESVKFLKKHDTELLDFMNKFIYCLNGVLGNDVHEWQFGIDNVGNIKCFDD